MTDETRKPKFKQGDVVRHKASGELAIVVSNLTHCVNEKHDGLFDHNLSGLFWNPKQHERLVAEKGPCKHEYSGKIELELSASSDSITSEDWKWEEKDGYYREQVGGSVVHKRRG